MNVGISLAELRAAFGAELSGFAMAAFVEMEDVGLVRIDGGRVALTARGRLVSNEVFERLLIVDFASLSA